MSNQTDPNQEPSQGAGVEDGRRRTRRTRKVDYVIAIVINLIALYVLHNLLNWHVPFLTERFAAVLWAFDLSIEATIVANVLFLVYDAGWFKHLAQIALDVLGLVVIATLYGVFPFAFGPFGNQIGRLALLAAGLGLGIALIVEAVQLLLGRDGQ